MAHSLHASRKTIGLVRWGIIALLGLFAVAAPAQEQPSTAPTPQLSTTAVPPTPASVTTPASAGAPGTAVTPPTPPTTPARSAAARSDKAAAALRQSRSLAHLNAGRRLAQKAALQPALDELALSNLFEPHRETLLEIARLCRRIEWDYQALTVYQRLESDEASAAVRAEIQEELTALRVRLDDSDINQTQMLRTQMDQAKRAFQSGRFSVAWRAFAVAYALRPLPRILWNAAQAYRRGNQADEAYALYSRFLEEEPETPLRKETAGYMNELRPLVFRPPLYKRGWVWAVAGVSAAVLAATAVGLAVGLSDKDPATDSGTIVVRLPLHF